MIALKKIGVDKYIDIALLMFLALFPLFASPFRTEMLGKFIVFVIFAFSLDLLWGYTGLMNLGHAVLFGLGGYVLAISYSIRNGVPPFMLRFGIEEIPAWLVILKSTTATYIVGLLLPAVIAGIIGWFIFSSRVNGVFFSIITLALAQIFDLFILNEQKFTGGFNGIGGMPRLLIGGNPLTLNQMYYVILGACVLVYLFCRWLTVSHFGKVIQAIRENPNRLEFLGYNPAKYKTLIFFISGMLAGLAGMLYVPINGMISPNDAGMAFSTAVIVWLAVGGRGNLTGAAVGTLLINFGQSILSEHFAEYWQLTLGIIVVLVVFFVPDGLIGKLINWQYNCRAYTKSDPKWLIWKRSWNISAQAPFRVKGGKSGTRI